jgi:Tfp pilus assembly protein PilN
MSSHALVVQSSTDRGEARRTSRATAVKGRGALGGEPRVSLLPAEVNDVAKARAARRRLGVGVVFVLLFVLAGVGGAYYLSMIAESELASARSSQASLLAQEAQFSDLKAAKTGIATIEAGQYVGASTEIDWTSYLESLQATLPAGVVITSVAIDSASPFMDYAQSSSPLEGSRVATLLFTATSPGLPSIPSWLDGLSTLKGFADAVPGSVNVGNDGTYVVNITMHINSDAFAHRFPGEDSK